MYLSSWRRADLEGLDGSLSELLLQKWSSSWLFKSASKGRSLHKSFAILMSMMSFSCWSSGVSCRLSGLSCGTWGTSCRSSGVSCWTSGVSCRSLGVSCVTSGASHPTMAERYFDRV
jgi:hypothetical protein